MRRLFGAFCYLLFLFAVVEIALQVFYYVTAGDFLFRRTAQPLYRSEPYAGFGNKPGLVYDHHTAEFRARYTINQAGFRVPRPGVEYSFTKPADTYRIMLLGPSFAYGWGVDYEKSFAALLPKFLQADGFAPGKHIELIDAGVPALYAGPQLNWYRHVGALYHPDLVIQFVYGPMAIPAAPPQRMVVDGDGYISVPDLPPAQVWRERAKKLATVFYGWMIWTELQNRFNPHPAVAVSGAGREMAARVSAFNPGHPAEREAIGLYRQIAQGVQASGAQLRIVYFPLSYGVHPQDEARWRHLGIQDVPAQRAFDRAFVAYLNGQGIAATDITESLRAAAGSGQRLYYWLDIHWTPTGNAIAAKAAAASLAH